MQYIFCLVELNFISAFSKSIWSLGLSKSGFQSMLKLLSLTICSHGRPKKRICWRADRPWGMQMWACPCHLAYRQWLVLGSLLFNDTTQPELLRNLCKALQKLVSVYCFVWTSDYFSVWLSGVPWLPLIFNEEQVLNLPFAPFWKLCFMWNNGCGQQIWKTCRRLRFSQVGEMKLHLSRSSRKRAGEEKVEITF